MDYNKALTDLTTIGNEMNVSRQSIWNERNDISLRLEEMKREEIRLIVKLNKLELQKRLLQRLKEGFCFIRVYNAKEYDYKECTKKSKINCERCNVPVCGIHGKKNRYGGFAHNCNDYPIFEKNLADQTKLKEVPI